MTARDPNQDPESGLRQAMIDAGIPPVAGEHLTLDGKIHRYTVAGDKPKSDNGWYIAFPDGLPAAAFGSWKAGVTSQWCHASRSKLTADQRAEFRAKMDEAARQRAAETAVKHAECAVAAAKMWADAAPVDDHPYLTRKKVRAYGLREKGDALLVPITDTTGKLHSLQRIAATGDKLFLPGSAVEGHFFPIGSVAQESATILVCEGYATGATLHEATGAFTVCAFNAGNLVAVSAALRRAHPKAKIVLCADNDRHTTKPLPNPGVTFATKAAHQVAGRVAVPPDDIEGTDFNDLAAARGLEAVRAIVLPAATPVESELHYTSAGRLRSNLHNATLILRKDFAGRLCLDEFTGDILLDGRQIEDDDVARIVAKVQKERFCDIDDPMLRAIRIVAAENPFNSARDWLEAEQWDGTPRLDHYLIDHFGAADDDYTRFVGRYLLVAMAARILKPGCKADMMPVLVGGQGVGKSTVLAALGGPFCGHVGEAIGSKDFLAAIQRYALVEIEELAAFNKADNDTLKKCLSATIDEFRRPYGKLHERRPRHCVFVGTTNRDTFLTDPTGARRYLPLQVGDIDVPAVAAIAAQLRAEAVTVFLSDWQFWRAPDCAPERQDARFVRDEWLHDQVRDYLEKNSAIPRHRTRDIIAGCEIPPNMARATQMQLPKVMADLGYEKVPDTAFRGYRLRWAPDLR